MKLGGQIFHVVCRDRGGLDSLGILPRHRRNGLDAIRDRGAGRALPLSGIGNFIKPAPDIRYRLIGCSNRA